MNVENIITTIELLKQAKIDNCLDMTIFQDGKVIVDTYEEVVLNGNKVCLAGLVGVSQAWRDMGGRIDKYGAPKLGSNSSSAMAYWFDVDYAVAHGLIAVASIGDIHPLYQKKFDEVTADDVIKVLEELMQTGEESFIEKYKII